MKLINKTKEKVRYYNMLFLADPIQKINMKEKGNQISFDFEKNDEDITEYHCCYYAVTLTLESVGEQKIKDCTKDIESWRCVSEVIRLNEKEALVGYMKADEFVLTAGNSASDPFTNLVWEFFLVREIEPDTNITKLFKGKKHKKHVHREEEYGKVCFDKSGEDIPANHLKDEIEGMFERLFYTLSNRCDISKYIKEE